MFTRTFSLSPFTTFDNLLRAACSFWGLIYHDFAIYFLDDDQAQKPINLSKEQERVLQYLDSYAQTSDKAKNNDDQVKKDEEFQDRQQAKFYIGRHTNTKGYSQKQLDRSILKTLADKTMNNLDDESDLLTLN